MMSTKSANGGALICIRETMNSKLRPDLTVGKEKELESIFIEILQKSIQKCDNWLHLQASIYGSERIQWSLFKIFYRKTCQRKEVILLGNFKIGPIESTKWICFWYLCIQNHISKLLSEHSAVQCKNIPVNIEIDDIKNSHFSTETIYIK